MKEKGVHNKDNQQKKCPDILPFKGMPDEFTQGQIKVECLYPLHTVTGLEISGKLNHHGMVTVKGVLKDGGTDFIHQAGSSDRIAVYGENGEGRTLLFSGVITGADVFFRDHVRCVEIKGMSWSSIMDYEEKSRSFQDKGTSYADLVGRVAGGYPGGAFVNGTGPSGKPVGQFLLQYRETDWEFLKRLATHFHTQLVADISGESPRFWFGLPMNRAELKSAGGVAAVRDMAGYHGAVSAGFPVQEGQFVK